MIDQKRSQVPKIRRKTVVPAILANIESLKTWTVSCAPDLSFFFLFKRSMPLEIVFVSNGIRKRRTRIIRVLIK